MVLRQQLLSGLALATALVGPAWAQPQRATRPPPAPPPATVGLPASPGAPRTLADALAATYSNQPALQAERAKLRATDENVPAALSGWRPTVVLAGTAGYGDGVSRTYTRSLGSYIKSPTQRDIATAQATVTQPLYTGGRTQANVNRAKNQVMAERANLMAQEQTSFTNAVNAYVGVIQAQQLLALNINNEQVLERQLQATNDRFRVGEITRTDVAQAEAALAGARAQRQTAEGNLQTARGTFQQVIGYLPPGNLIEPQPLGAAGSDRTAGVRGRRQQQSDRGGRPVQRCRVQGRGGRCHCPVAAAGQPAGPDLRAAELRRPQQRVQRLPDRRAGLRADLPGRIGICRRAPGPPDPAADAAAGR